MDAMADFERLGLFYLGRNYDPERQQPTDELTLYNARDLTTHAICVGMTGSGKTGLCITLLEEAAIDEIPAIVIDPKGDIANLLLTFPDLRPEDFAPWVDEDEARRQGRTVQEYAAQQASLWEEGLREWGQGPERIRRLRASADLPSTRRPAAPASRSRSWAPSPPRRPPCSRTRRRSGSG
jgi:DNA helicase HerA-like ATPase